MESNANATFWAEIKLQTFHLEQWPLGGDSERIGHNTGIIPRIVALDFVKRKVWEGISIVDREAASVDESGHLEAILQPTELKWPTAVD